MQFVNQHQRTAMKTKLLTFIAIQIAAGVLSMPLRAQDATPAPTDAEKEIFYAQTIENRVGDILKALNLSDSGKSNAVHDVLVSQYHDLRVRDAAIDTRLRVDGKEVNYANRAPLLVGQSKALHDQFVAKLNAMLAPADVEKIKDLMTYNKVKVTYDAYCAMISNLTDEEKAKIMESLKAAREDAVDGGSAPEKSAIFQKYKDQINSYLDARGHDTGKALKEWAEAHPNTNNPVAK
jgi:hypothetical protein